jgi:hypothetical protein
VLEIYRAFPVNGKFNEEQRDPNNVPLFLAAGDRSLFAKLIPNMADRTPPSPTPPTMPTEERWERLEHAHLLSPVSCLLYSVSCLLYFVSFDHVFRHLEQKTEGRTLAAV